MCNVGAIDPYIDLWLREKQSANFSWQSLLDFFNPNSTIINLCLWQLKRIMVEFWAFNVTLKSIAVNGSCHSSNWSVTFKQKKAFLSSQKVAETIKHTYTRESQKTFITLRKCTDSEFFIIRFYFCFVLLLFLFCFNTVFENLWNCKSNMGQVADFIQTSKAGSVIKINWIVLFRVVAIVSGGGTDDKPFHELARAETAKATK